MCLYCDQMKQSGQSLHNLYSFSSDEVVCPDLIQSAFTLIRGSGKI